MHEVTQQDAARAEGAGAEAESPEGRARGLVHTPSMFKLAEGHGLPTYAASELTPGRLRAAGREARTGMWRPGTTLRVANSNAEQEKL